MYVSDFLYRDFHTTTKSSIQAAYVKVVYLDLSINK